LRKSFNGRFEICLIMVFRGGAVYDPPAIWQCLFELIHQRSATQIRQLGGAWDKAVPDPARKARQAGPLTETAVRLKPSNHQAIIR
jgi:hypothetical protein